MRMFAKMKTIKELLSTILSLFGVVVIAIVISFILYLLTGYIEVAAAIGIVIFIAGYLGTAIKVFKQ